jgi:dTDP-glucose pyrophosphorylase
MNSVIIKNYQQYICYSDDSIVNIIKKLNSNKLKFKFQVALDKNFKVKGTITDGDIRRGILKHIPLSSSISKVMNKNYSSGKINDDINNVRIFNGLKITDKNPFLPIVNNKNILDSILAFSDFSNDNSSILIMAGGFGKRLGKYTKDKPKTLVEVAGKPILQYILDNIMASRIRDINISVYYKAEKISEFINKNNLSKKINIVYEERPLGTIGALGLLKSKKCESYIVCNADVIMDVPLDDFITFHNDNKNDITIGAAVHEHEVPYGVIKYDKLGQFSNISEKPKFKNFISAGIYAISKKTSLLIPKNKNIDIPEFFNIAKTAGYKIGVFPVHEYWTDVGIPEALEKANKKYKKLNKENKCV